MITHLKNHPMEFGLYKYCKAEKGNPSQNQKAVPIQSQIPMPLQNNIIRSTQDAQNKA